MDKHMHHHHHHHVEPNVSGSTTAYPDAQPTMMSTLAGAVLTAVTTAMTHGAQHNGSMHDTVLSDGHSVHSSQHHHHSTIGPSSGNSHSAHVHGLSGDQSSATDHMVMYFHSSVDTVILFKEWTTSSAQGLFGSVVVIFLMAMLYEGIKFFREYMFKRYFTSLEYSSVSVLGDDGKTVTEVHKVARNRMFSWPHTIQTALHMVQMILSYFLMLIFMTYNVWLCLGVVLGAGTGYFLFGWKKATVVDITEHCH